MKIEIKENEGKMVQFERVQKERLNECGKKHTAFDSYSHSCLCDFHKELEFIDFQLSILIRKTKIGTLSF